MKSITLFILTLFIGNAFAQSDCSPFVPVTKGSKWEITNYSPKGKELGISKYELIEMVDTDSGSVFTIKITSVDKKGNEAMSNEFQSFCVNGQYKIDMAFIMNSNVMQTTESMDMEMKTTDFEIPSMNASPGEFLKDASFVANISMNSTPLYTMTIMITERKVEGKEEKTTVAGTFECLVLHQKISTKMMSKNEAYSREWYAEKVGMVRSESYDKNGKLSGYSELTMLQTN